MKLFSTSAPAIFYKTGCQVPKDSLSSPHWHYSSNFFPLTLLLATICDFPTNGFQSFHLFELLILSKLLATELCQSPPGTSINIRLLFLFTLCLFCFLSFFKFFFIFCFIRIHHVRHLLTFLHALILSPLQLTYNYKCTWYTL